MLTHLKILVREHLLVLQLFFGDHLKKIRSVVHAFLGDLLLILQRHRIILGEGTVSVGISTDLWAINPVFRRVVGFHVHLLVVSKVIFHGSQQIGVRQISIVEILIILSSSVLQLLQRLAASHDHVEPQVVFSELLRVILEEVIVLLVHGHIKFGCGILQWLLLVFLVIAVNIPRFGLQLLFVQFEVAKINEHGLGSGHQKKGDHC